jgi:hypothetical protein
VSEAPCPICRHPLDGHSPSCAEAGCACIFDPKGHRVVGEGKRPLAFGSFDATPAAERARVTTRAPSFFKPKSRGGPRIWGVLVLLALAAGVCFWLFGR